MPSDGKRSHCLWQGELKIAKSSLSLSLSLEINHTYTVKPALVTTSIKQYLVLCDLNLNFPLTVHFI
jgi:hypothetical protein